MAIAQVAHTKLTPVGTNGGTTAAINTTGANLIRIIVGHYHPTAGSLVLSDNQGNTYTLAITKFDGGASDVSIFYKKTPTTNASHTFTLAGTTTYCCMSVAAFSGVDTAFGIDQISAGGSNSGSPVQPGTVTPGANGSLVCTGASVTGDATNTRVFGINAGMSITDEVPYNSGVNFGGMGADLIQGTAAAINPSVTYTGTVSGMAAATITFRPVAGTDYTLTAAQGAYTESGQAATLKCGRVLTAAQGSFVESGQAAGLKSSRGVTAAYGSFVLTGKTATLKAGRKLIAAYGAFVETGKAASLLTSRSFDADYGLYALTGSDISFDDDPKWVAAHICGETPDPWAKVDPLRRT